MQLALGPSREAHTSVPYGLWSLWDMYRYEAEHLVMLARNLKMLEDFIDNPPQQWNALLGPPPTEDRDAAIARYLEVLRKSCALAGLDHSAGLIEDCMDPLPKSSEAMRVLFLSIVGEMKRRLYLYCPPDRATYWECDTLLKEDAKKKFPNVVGEIRSASTSYAYGMWIASVFHSMRAAELGLRILANDLKVTFPHGNLDLEQWLTIIEQLESKIKAIQDEKKSTDRAKRQAFYSQAAAQFRYFKDGYRVRVAHVHDPFTQGQALSILNQTCEFFDVLAERLQEQE